MEEAHEYTDAYVQANPEVIEVHPMMIAGCVGYHDITPQNVVDIHLSKTVI